MQVKTRFLVTIVSELNNKLCDWLCLQCMTTHNPLWILLQAKREQK